MREGAREGAAFPGAPGLLCTVSGFPRGRHRCTVSPVCRPGFSHRPLQDELDVECFLKHQLVILSPFTERERKFQEGIADF